MEYSITIPEDLLTADLNVLSPQLNTLIDDLVKQRERVQKMMSAEAKVEEIRVSYHVAVEGGKPAVPPTRGDDIDMTQWREWRQPLGAHDAYPKDWVLRHNGLLYQTERAANVWEPGTPDSGWIDVTPAPGEPLPTTPDEVEYVFWEAWVDYHDGIDDGIDLEGNPVGRDYVQYGDMVYGCVQAHRSQPDWTPVLTPALWVEIGPAPDTGEAEPIPDPLPEPDPTPDPDPEPSADVWVQPEGGHDAYAKNAVVTHKGQTWTSNLDGNVWEPGVYGWTVAP